MKGIILEIINIISALFLFIGVSFADGTRSTIQALAPSMRSNISQYGITWTFDKAYLSGQFVTGDYWVIGPVEIIDISPKSVIKNGRVLHGSMINPGPSWDQGYDSMLGGRRGSAKYLPSLNAARPGGKELSESNPLRINHAASLMSAVSLEDRSMDEGNQVAIIAVLTILDAIPPSLAFRPAFSSLDKRIRHTVDDMRYEYLKELPLPQGPLDAPSTELVSAKFQKVWPDHFMNYSKESSLPAGNMPNYGREVAALVSDAALLLVLGPKSAAKEELANRMVQVGLDYYGLLLRNGGDVLFEANGGHCSGRAFPFVLAGYLLQDEEMLSLMKRTGLYAYQAGHREGDLPRDYIHFQEIDQTFFVTERDVARTNSDAWRPYTANGTYKAVPYTHDDVGLAEWGIKHAADPSTDNKDWGAAYRNVNSIAWSGSVLASRILGIQDLFNAPALFAYMDRWMATAPAGKRAYSRFMDQMWASLRVNY